MCAMPRVFLVTFKRPSLLRKVQDDCGKGKDSRQEIALRVIEIALYTNLALCGAYSVIFGLMYCTPEELAEYRRGSYAFLFDIWFVFTVCTMPGYLVYLIVAGE